MLLMVLFLNNVFFLITFWAQCFCYIINQFLHFVFYYIFILAIIKFWLLSHFLKLDFMLLLHFRL